MPINPTRPRQGRTERAEKESEKLQAEVRRQELVQLNAKVPPGLRKRLKRLAVEEDREMEDLVVEALEHYLGER